MSQVYTLSVRVGAAEKWAESSTACATLQDAIRNAARLADEMTRGDYESPLLSIRIEAGDYAPRIHNGKWIAAPATGWEA